MLDDPRAQTLEHGHDLEPHAGAEETRVTVRWVGGVRERVASDVRVDVGAAGPVKGADPVAVEGRKCREAPGARSPKDSHENGLGPVIGVVSGGDPVGSDVRCRTA
jgi:hypothetical protein